GLSFACALAPAVVRAEPSPAAEAPCRVPARTLDDARLEEGPAPCPWRTGAPGPPAAPPPAAPRRVSTVRWRCLGERTGERPLAGLCPGEPLRGAGPGPEGGLGPGPW